MAENNNVYVARESAIWAGLDKEKECKDAYGKREKALFKGITICQYFCHSNHFPLFHRSVSLVPAHSLVLCSYAQKSMTGLEREKARKSLGFVLSVA